MEHKRIGVSTLIWIRFFLLISLSAIFFPGQLHSRAQGEALVELACRLEAGKGIAPAEPVLLQLRHLPTGQIHSVRAGAGDIARFNLPAGYYFCCVWMNPGAPSCRTFDLSAPAAEAPVRFNRTFRLNME